MTVGLQHNQIEANYLLGYSLTGPSLLYIGFSAFTLSQVNYRYLLFLVSGLLSHRFFFSVTSYIYFSQWTGKWKIEPMILVMGEGSLYGFTTKLIGNLILFSFCFFIYYNGIFNCSLFKILEFHFTQPSFCDCMAICKSFSGKNLSGTIMFLFS